MTRSSTPLHAFTALLVRILRGLLTRIYLLPLYAFIAVPWLVILFTTTSNGSFVFEFAFSLTALLAGKPDADNLDETDIGRAMLMLFALYSLAAEIISALRGIPLDSAKHYRRQFLTQSAMVIIGWGAASAALYVELGAFSYMLGIVFSAFTVGGLYLVYLLRVSSKKLLKVLLKAK